MRWAEQQRMDWIANRIRQRRRINRKDIMEMFRISLPQASIDLRKFMALHPDSLTYDTKAKCYRANKGIEK